MKVNEQKPFKFIKVETRFDGVKAYKVLFARTVVPAADETPDKWTSRGAVRRAFGRALVLDPKKVDLKIYPCYELIHRSWMPGTHNFVRLGPNLGTTVREFIFDGGGPELRDLSRFDKQRGKRVYNELRRCFFACNTLQTGFVRSNGFVIAPQPGEQPPGPVLFRKPDGAFGLFDREYLPLGPITRQRDKEVEPTRFNGLYDVIVLELNPRVCTLQLRANQCGGPLPGLAICSPIVLKDGIPKPPEDIPYCSNNVDQTIGNEVNWDPATACTSFTAFGVGKGKIVAVSMFESLRAGDPACNRGITASEMGWLMSRPKLGAKDGVIGGGAADTQQFLAADCDGMPTLLEAPPRFKRAEEGGVAEVLGARGLGAIFAALQM
jgi:hypothetical protein